MKAGKSLVELAAEIERQKAAKVDYIADTRQLDMVLDSTARESEVLLAVSNAAPMPISGIAHRQIGERLGIPARYYDRMRSEHPELLAHNVNHLLHAEPEKRLVRTLDGRARAFLSNRYQRIDNHHVAEAVLPVLLETPGIEVLSSEITESRLYIKAVSHKVQREIASRRVGDIVEAGVMITNSEIGLGAVSVLPWFHFLVCTNGMVRQKEGLRAAHLGTKHDGDQFLAEILQDDTRAVLDRGILLKVRDVVRAAMDEVRFGEAVSRMQFQTTQGIKGNPAKAVEILSDDFVLGEGERGSVLRHLIEGGDVSRYGLMNAITRTAEDAPDYDRATELETMGGRILDLPAANWSRIAEAA